MDNGASRDISLTCRQTVSVIATQPAMSAAAPVMTMIGMGEVYDTVIRGLSSLTDHKVLVVDLSYATVNG